MYTALCKALDPKKGLLVDVSMQTGNLSPWVYMPFIQCMCVCVYVSVIVLLCLPICAHAILFIHIQDFSAAKKSKLFYSDGHASCRSNVISFTAKLNTFPINVHTQV